MEEKPGGDVNVSPRVLNNLDGRKASRQIEVVVSKGRSEWSPRRSF
jgi:intracellular sulfur oxidation DsrE/DsrF family protein